jgi:hypothetical protein
MSRRTCSWCIKIVKHRCGSEAEAEKCINFGRRQPPRAIIYDGRDEELNGRTPNYFEVKTAAEQEDEDEHG